MLSKILENPEVLSAMLFCFSAAFGQVAHTIKKWADGESSCPLGWMTTNIRRTVGAIIGNGGAMLLFLQAGGSDAITAMWNAPNAGWWSIFLFGVMQGFAIDSALNKGARTEWSAEKRAAEEEKK